jgi:CBS domain containing-hemolysin-like protein
MLISELFEQLPVITRAVYSYVVGSLQPVWLDFLGNSIFVALFISVTLVVVQTAKALTLKFPEGALSMVSIPLRWIYICFGPLVLFVHSAAHTLLSTFGVSVTHERDLSLSSDDLSEFMWRSSQAGVIERTEQQLIEGVVELSDTSVREVMTSRRDVVAVKEGEPLSTVVAMIKREGVSRVLVHGGDLDDVRGMLLAKDLITLLDPGASSRLDWGALVRPVSFVPTTKNVRDLLKEFREKRIHLAAVLDEHGSLDGVVTLEDLVEEIVGDIADEFDAPANEHASTVHFDGTIILEGSLSLADLFRHHGIALPEGDYDTVAGFVLSQLGHVPVAGESFTFEDSEIRVRDVQNNRVVRVSMQRTNSNKLRQSASQKNTNNEPLAVAVDAE